MKRIYVFLVVYMLIYTIPVHALTCSASFTYSNVAKMRIDLSTVEDKNGYSEHKWAGMVEIDTKHLPNVETKGVSSTFDCDLSSGILKKVRQWQDRPETMSERKARELFVDVIIAAALQVPISIFLPAEIYKLINEVYEEITGEPLPKAESVSDAVGAEQPTAPVLVPPPSAISSSPTSSGSNDHDAAAEAQKLAAQRRIVEEQERIRDRERAEEEERKKRRQAEEDAEKRRREAEANEYRSMMHERMERAKPPPVHGRVIMEDDGAIIRNHNGGW